MNPLSQPTAPLSAQRKLELLDGSYPYVYQSDQGINLTAYCFFPKGHQPGKADLEPKPEPKPAIVFFHGGLWDVSMVTQFSPHAMHFASRGMIAIVVEYRVTSLHQAKPADSFEDAQMAMQWLRHNHQELGVDPDRIIATGAGSGAYMALSLAMRKKLPVIDGYTSRPQGVIALSSIISTSRRYINPQRFPHVRQSKKESPANHIRRKLPPCLMIHGKGDTIAPHFLVTDFVRIMQRKRNHCELVDFDACNHSFFNFNVSPKHFEITLNTMDAFVTQLGYIDPIEYI